MRKADSTMLIWVWYATIDAQGRFNTMYNFMLNMISVLWHGSGSIGLFAWHPGSWNSCSVDCKRMSMCEMQMHMEVQMIVLTKLNLGHVSCKLALWRFDKVCNLVPVSTTTGITMQTWSMC